MMAGWLRGRGRTEGDTTVTPELRTVLDEALAPLDGKGPLARDLRDYLLTGRPVSPLADAAQDNLGRLGRVLGLWGGMNPDWVGVYRRLYSAFNEADPVVTTRWARVVEAVLQPHSYLLEMRPIAGGRWAEALLIAAGTAFPTTRSREPETIPLDYLAFERMLVAAGDEPGALLLEGFLPFAGQGYHSGRGRAVLRRLAGYDAALRRHAEPLRPALLPRRAEDRRTVVEMLGPASPETLRLFSTELAELATSASSQVRVGASLLLGRCDEAAVGPLRALAEQGKPETRLHALRLLWSTQDPSTRAWARDRAANDRAASVRALVDEWTRVAVSEEPAEPEDTPPAPQIDWAVPVTAELRRLLDRMAAEIDRAIDAANVRTRAYAKQWEAANPGRKASWFRESSRLPRDWVSSLLRELEAGCPPRAKADGVPSRVPVHLAGHIVEGNAAHPALGAAGLTIVLNSLGLLFGYQDQLLDTAAASYNALHEATGRPSLLEISTMLDAMGADGGRAVFRRYGAAYGEVLGRSWPDEDVAPFVASHLDLVVARLAPTAETDYAFQPTTPYLALATLPALPRRVVDALFAVALSTRKTARREAQDALARVPGFEDRVVTALCDGKGEVRTVAAQWLGRLRYPSAVADLEAALAKEKQDVAKGAMLDALEALGQPVEKYLHREALAGQAASAVAKGLPRDLRWMAWEALPSVRWTDSGDAVPLEVLQWFVAQAVKAKSPEPNAVLRKYCAMFDPGDREAFGQFLLEAWIAEDLRPIDSEEAQLRAEQRAQWTHQSMARWPQAYENDPLFGASVEQLTAAYLPGCLREPVGSATASKGVLAVAAACAGERAAPVAARYLKEWYGMRASQGKALIAMLAWVDHPSATQLMLSVGSRFRTKSFQEEATRQAEALAERKGWSLGELADRTIPTAGFDEDGVLELSYGDRVFTATLQPDLTVVLQSPEGKRITSLPAPRQSDDEARAKESKKALTAAKKEIKSIGKLQTDRLYEALCTQRTWLFDDWQRYLNRHPVVRHLTQRLAWVAVTPAGAVVFRPLDDGTLTDVDDEEVTVPADAVVAVAHDTNLDEATAAAWQQHFVDYEVVPLFQQLGKGLFELPEESGSAREDTSFKGHLVEAFALRGRAAKLGYARGPAEDGGCFYTYEKRFPTLGLSAVVEFSGNWLPEQNRTVALTALRFAKHGPNGSATPLRLGDVPAVLLSEAYADMRLMASDGTGHDPDWEKKVVF